MQEPTTSIERRLRKTTRGVLEDVFDERQQQDAKWGEQNHDPFAWLAILGEEFGEVSEAALTWRFAPVGDSLPGAIRQDNIQRSNYRAELIQVAAVAVAMAECLDRNIDWPWSIGDSSG